MKTSMSRWIMLIAIAATAVGCAHHRSYNLPPAERLMEPGPGVGGPGPGVLAPPPAPVVNAAMMMAAPMGAAMGVPMAGGGMMMPAAPPTVQILFSRPESMMVAWDVGGVGYFDSEPLVVPGRSTFPTGGIYRLKIANIEGREGVERYPTLEVGPVTPRTEAYLAHNAIPIQFTEEDFDQVTAGNFVTKVIYLPDPEFQELALAGVETLVSTRLDPGIDPIVEADRRGSILAIIRMGNKDLEVPGAMDNSQGGVMQAGAEHGMVEPWELAARTVTTASVAARPEPPCSPVPLFLTETSPRTCRASRYRNGACRSPARRSDCPVRRTFRSEPRPD